MLIVFTYIERETFTVFFITRQYASSVQEIVSKKKRYTFFPPLNVVFLYLLIYFSATIINSYFVFLN